MKKLGKILLVASSVLSVGALALSIDAVSKNKEFTYSVGETNNDGFGIKRVAQGETVEKPTFTTGGEKTIISPAVAQAKTNENKSKSLRFVAAVSMENDAALNEYLTGLNGKEIGFHVAYDKDANKVDLHLRVQYSYRSISAGENTYRANGAVQEGEKGIADWITACGSTYASPENVTYNYFLVLEIDEIAEDYHANIVTVQPYIKNGTKYTYASHYKKANANERSLFFLDVNGTQTLMKDNKENGTTDSGKIKDEYMLTNVELNKGDVISIVDSIGVKHNKFDHNIFGKINTYTAKNTCSYDFYYKSVHNTVDYQDETYINQKKVTFFFECKNNTWYDANAYTSMHLFGKEVETKWPGEKMDRIEDTKVFYKEVDVTLYSKFLFARAGDNYDEKEQKMNTNQYWGAKTDNITITSGYNYYTLEKDDFHWENQGGACNVTGKLKMDY